MVLVGVSAEDRTMTSPWPAPSPTPLSQPVPPLPPLERPKRVGRVLPTPVPAVAWLSAFGAVLLLVAAIALTPGWNTLTPGVRLVIIGCANLVIFALAEKTRSTFPIVGRALSHLAPVLVGPSAILAAAALQAQWPTAILVGGVVGLVASELQQRRFKLALLPLASVIAVGLASAGIAASFHLPVGPLVAVIAIVAVALRRETQGVMLAICAALVPALGSVGQLGIGPGTLIELGARGDVLRWAAPVAGILAAAVLLRRAARLQNLVLVASGGASLIVNVLVGVSFMTLSRSFTVCLPGVLLIAAEALAARQKDDPFWGPIGRAVATAVALVATSIITSMTLGAALSLLRHPDWALAAGLALMATGLQLAANRWAAQRVNARLVLAESLFFASLACLAVTGMPVVGAFALLGFGFYLASRLSPLPILPGVFALAAWIVAGFERPHATLLGRNGAAVVVQLGALALGLVALRATAGRTARLLIVVWTVPVMAVMAWYLTSSGTVGILVSLATVLVCLAHLRRDGETVWIVLPVGVLAYMSLSGQAWQKSLVMVALLLTIAGAETLVHRGKPYRLAFVSLIPATMLAVAAASSIAGHDASIGLLVTGAAAAIGAYSVRKRVEADVLAMAFLVTGLLTAVGSGATVVASVAGVLFGLFLTIEGASRLDNLILLTGVSTAIAALATLPYTLGLDRFLDVRLAQYGWRHDDLAMGILVSVGLVFGVMLARYRPESSSWLTVSPALTLGSLYLLTTLIEGRFAARAGVTVGLGLIAIAVGGVRRLSAPLVIGTLTPIAAIVIMSGPALAQLSLWLWVALGGAFLIGLAMMIERTVVTENGDRQRVIEVVAKSFR